MAKKLILIHGRNFKPERDFLREIWFDALRHGLSRDYEVDVVTAFDGIDKDMVYYGDLSNAYLRGVGRSYDADADRLDREHCLDVLKGYTREAFLDNAGKDNYEALPGKTVLKEFFADVLGGPLAFFGLSEGLVYQVAPEMREYWNPDTEFGSDTRWTLTVPLLQALEGQHDVMLISHSLGTLIAYDVLWKFSHYGEYQHLRGEKLSCWITIGSPLADETVKNHLKGADAGGLRKYPHNIGRWVNVAAQDDYIAHDETVANDYRKMRSWQLVDSILDHRVYNLAVRHGKSNPHHGAGYLVHPFVSRLVADWLRS